MQSNCRNRLGLQKLSVNVDYMVRNISTSILYKVNKSSVGLPQVWMVVQRKWMYLEGIFIGGDIRSQLPEEAKKFDQIDKTFKKV